MNTRNKKSSLFSSLKLDAQQWNMTIPSKVLKIFWHRKTFVPFSYLNSKQQECIVIYYYITIALLADQGSNSSKGSKSV